jgi:hypothetical protein
VFEINIPNWLASLAGIETSAGEGASCAIRWEWPFSITLTTIFFLLLSVSLYVSLRGAFKELKRRQRLVLCFLRFVQVLLIVGMIATPMLQFSRSGLPTLLLLLDDSASMSQRELYEEDEQASLQRITSLTWPDSSDEGASSDENAIQPESSNESDLPPSRWDLAKGYWTARDARRLQSLQNRYKLLVCYVSTDEIRELEVADDGSLNFGDDREPDGESSPLGVRLSNLCSQTRWSPPAVVIIMSDGVTTSGVNLSEAASEVASLDVPIFTVSVGDVRPRRDAALRDLVADKMAFVNELVSVSCRLELKGEVQEDVRIELRDQHDGRLLSEAVVPSHKAARERHEIQLAFRPDRLGPMSIAVEVLPLEGETHLDNNRLEHVLQVRDEKIRVLFLQAYPSFEYRFLRDLLGREPTIDLETWLQDADAEHADQDPSQRRSFPTDREELFGFDCIIFGDVDPARLSRSQQDDLAAFVKDPVSGGALIFLAGPLYTPKGYINSPLVSVMPFDPSRASLPPSGRARTDGFRIKPTQLGLAFPGMRIADSPGSAVSPLSMGPSLPEARTLADNENVDTLETTIPSDEEIREYTGQTSDQFVWRNLPPAYWRLSIPDWKAGAMPLALTDLDSSNDSFFPLDWTPSFEPIRSPSSSRTDDERPEPLILFQRVDRGKVLFHASPTWRWSFRENEKYFARYWTQTIQALCRTELQEGDDSILLMTNQTTYHIGDPVEVVVRLFDEDLFSDQTITLILTSDNGTREEVELEPSPFNRNYFSTFLSNCTVGEYQLSWAAPLISSPPSEVCFEVENAGDEFARLGVDVRELRRAAEKTDGLYLQLSEADHLLQDLPKGRRVPLEFFPPRPLWNRWQLVLILLGLIIAEWALHKFL